MFPQSGDRFLQPKPEGHAQPTPDGSQGIAGAGNTGIGPKDGRTGGKHVKFIKLSRRLINIPKVDLWQTYRSNKSFFNICLRASDREVPCNAHILAEQSAFFRAKFSNLENTGGSPNVVLLEDVDGDTLETIVAALHSGTIKLSMDKIERFLHYADMLQLLVVKDACCQYMKKWFDEDSVGATLSLAVKFSCDEMATQSKTAIMDRFHEMRLDALENWPRPLFYDYISRDNLPTHSELQVLSAITKWCNYNGVEEFLNLLPAVRLDGMYAFELELMLQHHMVMKFPSVMEQVHAALVTAYVPNSPQRTPKHDPRKIRGTVAFDPPRRYDAPYSSGFGFAGAPPANFGCRTGPHAAAGIFAGAPPPASGFGAAPPAASGFGRGSSTAFASAGAPPPAAGFGGAPPPPILFGSASQPSKQETPNPDSDMEDEEEDEEQDAADFNGPPAQQHHLAY